MGQIWRKSALRQSCRLATLIAKFFTAGTRRVTRRPLLADRTARGGEGETNNVHVTVRDNNVDQALKALKKKMQREGVFREMKLRRSYEKPSERKAREKAEAVRRARKLERKRLERDGF
jgi:small subunit ribosomal protein S21